MSVATNDDRALLEELAVRYNSDKHGGHRYMQHYAKHFHKFRHQAVSILEIGIGGYDNSSEGGASLKIWKEYFPHGDVYGLDFYDKKGIEEPRIKTFKGSQADPVIIAGVLNLLPERKKFDVIIDDGSHRSEHVISTFMMLFQHLAPEGIYVIEDVQTAYWPSFGGNYGDNNKQTTMSYFKGIVDGLNWQEMHRPGYVADYNEENILGISFYHNMIFVEKGNNTEGSNFLRNNTLPNR